MSTQVGTENVGASRWTTSSPPWAMAPSAPSARQLASSSSSGFYIDLHIRCGYPPVVLQALNAEQGVAGVSESRTQ